MGQHPFTRKERYAKNLDKGTEKRTVYLINDIKLENGFSNSYKIQISVKNNNFIMYLHLRQHVFIVII